MLEQSHAVQSTSVAVLPQHCRIKLLHHCYIPPLQCTHGCQAALPFAAVVDWGGQIRLRTPGSCWVPSVLFEDVSHAIGGVDERSLADDAGRSSYDMTLPAEGYAS